MAEQEKDDLPITSPIKLLKYQHEEVKKDMDKLVKLVAEVVELETKPSVPIGETGQDAFGGTPTFTDRGMRKRAILNIGRQDVVVDGIEPLDPGIIVLGGSSDHLILDVEDAQEKVKLGDEITFYPGYGALLALSTSPYVQKVVVKG